MGAGVLLTIGSLLYMIILGVVYFKKKKIKSLENKIFSKIIIINVAGLILHLLLFCLMSYIGTDNIYTIIISKLYLIHLVAYMAFFTVYVFIISTKDYQKTEKNYKKSMIICISIIVAVSLLIFYLPISFYNEVGKMYSYGKAVNMVYFFSFSTIFLNTIFLLMNIKNALNKKYYPMLFYYLLGSFVAFIQFKYPYIQLMSALESLIIFLMYFTIENPDIKMIKELTYSKEVAEKAKNDTMNILNDISRDLKTPLDKLVSFGYKKIDKDNLEEMTKEIKYIQKFSLNLVDRISGNIDMAKIDSSTFNIQNKKFDTYEMLNDIKYLFNCKKGNKKITVTTDISDGINKVLYGDNDKCKQAVLYTFSYIIDLINTGTINVNIDNISVGRFCKLKFHFLIDNPIIKDSIYYNENDKKYYFLNKDIDYNILIKLLHILDGQIDIKMDESNSTEIVISINERIMPEYDIDEVIIIENNVKIKYFDLSDKRIAIIDDNNGKIKELVRLLKPYKVHIDIARTNSEINKLIESNKVLDMILIDDIMPEPMTDTDNYGNVTEYSASIKEYTKTLLKRANYDIPLIIMVTPNNKEYENKYLKSGFNDYIIKPVSKLELNEVLRKYFNQKKQ